MIYYQDLWKAQSLTYDLMASGEEPLRAVQNLFKMLLFAHYFNDLSFPKLNYHNLWNKAEIFIPPLEFYSTFNNFSRFNLNPSWEIKILK